jgi:sulfoquinovosidase
VPPLRPALAFLFVSTLAACNKSAAEPPSVDLGLGGGFTGTIEDNNRLVIASADGRILLDGLAPGTVPAGGPPLVGFAIQDLTTTFEMQAGAFMPTVTPAGAWRTATHLTWSGGTLALTDDSGSLLAQIAFSTPAAGHLVADVTPGDGPERRFSWGFACDADDHFAGFGAQTWDVDHLGYTVPVITQEEGIGKIQTDDYDGLWYFEGRRHSAYFPMPEYLSRRGYMLATETNTRPLFALCSESATGARLEVDLPFKVDVFDGPAPADAIDRATAALGRPRMPPEVAFAPWLDAIFGSTAVRDVAAKLRAQGIPTGVIWTEDWHGGAWNGAFYMLKEEWEVDTTLYPDFSTLASDLHGEGFDFFVYFNSFVYEDSKAWPETEPHGWLVKHPDGTDYTFLGGALTNTGMLDLDNPAARAWAVGKMQAAIALGADGWMNDFAEWLPTDGVTAAGPTAATHNLYPLRWEETARAAIDGIQDGQQRLFFGRSGWFGSPPLADVIWAGDQRTDFEPDDGMPTVLPIGIGLGLVGISTFGHDIAGYQSVTNPGSTKELFFRWTELGAWSPVMRTHHGSQPQLNWSWSKDAETIAHFKRYASLHMALVPFMEGLAKGASETGLPIWRGLAIGFPSDAAVWPITDEVMVGDGVLVAPVEVAGAVSRSVYLPAGTWFPWSGGTSIAGGQTVTVQAAVTEIPVFAQAGTVVPSFPDGVMTLVHGSAAVPDASSVGDDRVVYVFLGAGGSFTEAGGLGYTLANAGSAAGTLSWTWNGKALGACATPPAAPCAAASADGGTAYVTGPGALEVDANGSAAATLSVTGGSATRKLTIVVRR